MPGNGTSGSCVHAGREAERIEAAKRRPRWSGSVQWLGRRRCRWRRRQCGRGCGRCLRRHGRCRRRRRQDGVERGRLHVHVDRAVVAADRHLQRAVALVLVDGAHDILRIVDAGAVHMGDDVAGFQARVAIGIAGQHQRAGIGTEVAAQILVQRGQIQPPERSPGKEHVTAVQFAEFTVRVDDHAFDVDIAGAHVLPAHVVHGQGARPVRSLVALGGDVHDMGRSLAVQFRVSLSGRP